MGRHRIAPKLHAEASPLEWGAWIIRPGDPKLERISDAPNGPGVYAWYTEHGDLMYVGRSVHIATRLRQHVEGRFFMVEPRLFSYKEVPAQYVPGVEVAHIDALWPPENSARDSHANPFQAQMQQAIEAAWEGVWAEQRARWEALSTAVTEQIAAKLAARL